MTSKARSLTMGRSGASRDRAATVLRRNAQAKTKIQIQIQIKR